MNLKVVLVKSKYPRNIGMVARAMANFAVDELVLVSPQCELNEEAREGAAQGQSPLRNCRIYKDWAEYRAREPEGPRIAFSRRIGKRRQSMSLPELAQWPELQGERKVSLIFGAEDHGLSAEDLELAHRLAHFELPGELKSMNLSHAVVHVLSTLFPGLRSSPNSTPEEPIKLPDEILRHWLETLNFDLSQERWNAHIALKQLIMKSAPSEKEIQLLEAVIQQTVRRLKSDEI